MTSESTAAPAVKTATPRRPKTDAFDPEAFLEKTGVGRTLIELKKNQVLFSQGDEADAVFYLQQGNLKLTVVSQHGEEATVVNRFRKLGFIDYHGKLEVHSSLLNVIRHDGAASREIVSFCTVFRGLPSLLCSMAMRLPLP